MKILLTHNCIQKILKKSTLGLVILMCCLSSCVYSLFPIYTEETLIFEPALLGTWKDQDGYKITFERFSNKTSTYAETARKEKPIYTDSLIGEGWSIRSEEPISIEIGGKLVFDKDRITSHMDSVMQGLILEEEEEIQDNERTEEKEKSNTARWLLNRNSIKGSVSINSQKAYRMIVEDGEEQNSIYKVHLVKIANNYFIDLFPIINTEKGLFTENLFPVHTFMKVMFTEKDFKLISFDLKKLNELFVKKLVRLRYENVDGTVLITAQPEQIQKFLEVYSDNQEVYESPIEYTKISVR